MAYRQNINIPKETAEESLVSSTWSAGEKVKLYHISNRKSNDTHHERTDPTNYSVSLVRIATLCT